MDQSEITQQNKEHHVFQARVNHKITPTWNLKILTSYLFQDIFLVLEVELIIWY